MNLLSFDVSKNELAVFDGERLQKVKNTPSAIQAFLKGYPDWTVACEPTSIYHLELLDQAYTQGHRVYQVNPKEAKSYKDSLSFRAKTDPLDARYLYEYVLRNKDLLRAYQPTQPQLVKLHDLLRKRTQNVDSRTSLKLSYGPNPTSMEQEALDTLTRVIEDYERQLEQIAKSFPAYEAIRSIPGVGLITACVLINVLESRTFESADALVAFLGLDVRVRQSGLFKGQGKITKRGDRLFRYILCCAQRALLSSKAGAEKKAKLAQQKRHFRERIVIAARKILRDAWFLHKHNQLFDPQKWRWA